MPPGIGTKTFFTKPVNTEVEESGGSSSSGVRAARLEKPVRITEQSWPEETVPVVSIFCITYNHADFIRQAIEGFLRQETTFPVEIFIHDDASTDGTADIVRDYQAAYPRLFSIVTQAENKYSTVGFRVFFECLTRQRGEFVALCEGDDYWTNPHKLQIQVDLLSSQPRLSCCFHQTKVVDEENLVIRNENFRPQGSEFTFYECLTRLRKGYATCSMVFRTSALQNISSWFTEDPNDLFLELQLAKAGNIAFIDKNMAAYRRHSGGVWSSQSRVKQTLAIINRYEILLQDKSFSEAVKSRVEFIRDEYVQQLCMRGDCKSILGETNPNLLLVLKAYEYLSKACAKILKPVTGRR